MQTCGSRCSHGRLTQRSHTLDYLFCTATLDEWLITYYELWVTNDELWVTSYELLIIDERGTVFERWIIIMNY